MTYKTLQKEYLDLCIKNQEFRENRSKGSFSLTKLLDRYYQHSDLEISLDIARDYLYFLDDSYKIKEYQRPPVEKDCTGITNPYKGYYERLENE
jgi:hypothetical protein